MKPDWNNNTPLIGGGMILGSIVFGFLLVISNDIGIFEWAYQHQALAAGMLGVFAAGVTAILINLQIQQNYRFNKDARERRLIAAKSTFPLVLSDFTEYGKTCFQLSLGMCSGQIREPEIPYLEPKHIETIKECIEQADFIDQRQLSKFLRLYQVQRSRLYHAIENYSPWSEGEIEENRISHNEIADKKIFGNGGYLYSSAELYLSVNDLWKFWDESLTSKFEKKKSEGIKSLFIFHTAYNFEDWPLFIEHFKKTIDID